MKVCIGESDGLNIPSPRKCAWTVYVPGAGAGKGKLLYVPAVAVTGFIPEGIPVPVNVMGTALIPKPVMGSLSIPVSIMGAPGLRWSVLVKIVNVRIVGCVVGGGGGGGIVVFAAPS